MRAPGRRCAALGLALWAWGCTPGVDARPTARDIAVAGSSLRPTVRYALHLAHPGSATILVEFSADGGVAWRPAREAAGYPSEGTVGLAASPEGRPHLYLWNAWADLGPVRIPAVRVRVLGVVSAAFPYDGTVTETVAGPWTEPLPGDQASLSFPSALAFLGDGRLVVAERGAHRVLVAEPGTGRVRPLTRPVARGRLVHDETRLGDLTLQTPSALVAVSSAGRLSVLVADRTAQGIWLLDLGQDRARWTAGTGEARDSGDGRPGTRTELHGPEALAMARDGALYIADAGSHRVRCLGTDGLVRTVAGDGTRGASGDGGPATAARLDAPRGLAVDGALQLYIADTGNDRVRRLDLATGRLETLWPGLASPTGLALSGDGRTLYACATLDHQVHALDLETARSRVVAGHPDRLSGLSGDGGPACEAMLNLPQGLAVGPDGALWIADTYNHRVRRVDPADGSIRTVLGGAAPGRPLPARQSLPHQPRQVALGPGGELLLAVWTNLELGDQGDDLGKTVLRVDPLDGTLGTVGALGTDAGWSPGLATGSLLLGPMRGVACASDGAVYVSNDTREGAGVVRLAAGGPAVESLRWPFLSDLAWGRDGRLYFLSYEPGRRVLGRLDPRGPAGGTPEVLFQEAPAGTPQTDRRAREVQWWSPQGLDLTNAGRVYVADREGHSVLALDPATGDWDRIAGQFASGGYSGDGGPAREALLQNPADVAVDEHGDLYVADQGNHRIRRIRASDGTIQTVCGSGTRGGAGDGGPARSAQLDGPCGLAVQPGGVVYIVEDGGVRLRRVVIPRD